MTDQEVICTFMEPKPTVAKSTPGVGSPGGWWRGGLCAVFPAMLTLDALHEVEARLTDKHWPKYRSLIQDSADPSDARWSRILLHATAEQKIAALATVLRRAS